jgi:hypothetical protein
MIGRRDGNRFFKKLRTILWLGLLGDDLGTTISDFIGAVLF